MAHIEMTAPSTSVEASGRGARLAATDGGADVALELTLEQARSVGRSLIALTNRPPRSVVDGALSAVMGSGAPGRYAALMRHMGIADREALEDLTRLVLSLRDQRDGEARKRRQGRFFG